MKKEWVISHVLETRVITEGPTHAATTTHSPSAATEEQEVDMPVEWFKKYLFSPSADQASLFIA